MGNSVRFLQKQNQEKRQQPENKQSKNIQTDRRPHTHIMQMGKYHFKISDIDTYSGRPALVSLREYLAGCVRANDFECTRDYSIENKILK